MTNCYSSASWRVAECEAALQAFGRELRPRARELLHQGREHGALRARRLRGGAAEARDEEIRGRAAENAPMLHLTQPTNSDGR